jgi:uncharacterized protein (TIGR02217 family)
MSLTTTFIETQFPANISYGSQGGSGFNTTVFEATSGFEQRNINWSTSRAKYDVSHGIKTKDDMTVIVDFFMAMRGKAYAFRYKDWADFQIANQQIGTGDGANRVFQLIKVYADPLALQSFTRTIKKPVNGSLTTVLVAGAPTTQFVLDYTTGILTFNVGHAPTAGQSVVIGYIEFDVPVRFNVDELNIRQDFFQVESWEGIQIIEVKL